MQTDDQSQNVDVPADFVRRPVAFVIDVGSWLLLGLGLETLGSKSIVASEWFLPVTLGIWPPFLIISETLTGRTPGKFVVGIRVVDIRGRRPSIWRSIGRNVWKPLYFALPVVSWVEICPIFASEYRQRHGDKISGTIVVRRQIRAAPHPQ